LTILGSWDRASAIEYLCDICKVYMTATARADESATHWRAPSPERQDSGHGLRARP
jgi:hypothetical protein